MRHRITIAAIAALTLAGLCGWSLAQRAGDEAEVRVRKAAVGYYSAMIFADIDAFKTNTRSPLTIIRDGATTQRTEEQSQTLLHGLKTERAAKPITDDDRKLIRSRIQAVFDEADIQFLGANTAAVTFVLRPGTPAKNTGESLCMLVLYRKDDRWLVVSEVTDSTPLPRALTADPAQPASPPAK